MSDTGPTGTALGGYHGRALQVDLGAGTSHRAVLRERDLRRVVGGVGLGAWLLGRHSAPGLPWDAPAAPFVVALSPLVGSPLTTSAKYAVVAKSPLTGFLCDALASDRFAIELKACGCDALVLTGACEAWSLLVVDDGAARIEPANELVGLSAEDAETRVRERLGNGFRFFGIGPAGERLVRFATVSGGGRHAGRGGLGAVLGAKRLKGVAVRGTRRTPLADVDAVMEIARDLSRRSLGPATAKYRELGTVTNLLVMNRLGALPTRNFESGSFDAAERVSGEALHAGPSVRRHCAACTIGCEHVFQSSDGRSVRMEYEGLYALGPLCGIEERGAVVDAAALCDELGIDVISGGATVALAMSLTERGVIPDGPRFGSAADLHAALRSVCDASGPGALLGQGSRALAEHHGVPDLAVHVKGMELPGYDPRAMQTLAVGLAVSTRGADHNRSGAYQADLLPGSERTVATEQKGRDAARTELDAAILDSLVLCKFLRGVFDDIADEGAQMLAAVTGWNVDGEELRTVGRRVVTLRKLYNVREGWTRADDTLPPPLLDVPLALPDGPEVTLGRADLDRMIGAYYAAQGWEPDGSVPGACIESLDLADLLPHGLAVPGPTIPEAHA